MVNMSSKELDILREVGSIGSGQAATSLSSILNKKIDVSIGQTNFVPIHEFTSLVGGPDKVIVVDYAEFSGEIKGVIQLVFDRKAALRFIDLVLNKPEGTTKIIRQMDESAFKEVGNILFGAYISSLSNMLGIKVLFSVTNMMYDLAGAIMDYSLIKISQKSEKILTIEAKLIVANEAIDGTIIVLFEEDSLKKIVSTIEQKYLQS
jgi:chemotaxis protein CheC